MAPKIGDHRNLAALYESAPPPRNKIKFKLSLILRFKLFISFTYIHTAHRARSGKGRFLIP